MKRHSKDQRHNKSQGLELDQMKDLMIEKDIHKETHDDRDEDKDIYNHILYSKDNDTDKDEKKVKNVPPRKATHH